ncbi:extensin family protein [Rhodobacteraceae bacterium RKSG542]|nr:extensin family protein [Pseudovibrio flavus]
MPDVKGAGACGIKQPVKVDALKLDRGTLGLSMPIQANCGLVSAFDSWVQDDVLKIAKKQMGSELVGLKIAGSYSCRPRNNQRGAKLSEHGKGNAIDISGFVFKDGTVVSVKSGWKGKRKHRKFLQAVHKSACGTFSTVLGPNADRFHKDHFHLDLACHGKGCRVKICK